MTGYIGIDVSKATLDVAWLHDPEKIQFTRRTFSNDARGHREVSTWLKQFNAVDSWHVTLEATGVYHLGIASQLTEQTMLVSVINPLQAHHYAKGRGMRAKTDRLDSQMLAAYGYERKPPQWIPHAAVILELKALNVRLDAVEKDLRRERNRLEKATLTQHSPAVTRLIRQSIRTLEKQAEKLHELIEEVIASDEELAHHRELVLSIPGIGDVCARYLIAEIYPQRFQSASQCAAYMGLVPVPQQSGRSLRVQLSRGGNRRLKAKLYMAAIAAKKHNPVLSEFYERLLARGKPKLSALCAVMRRLVQFCFGVIKHQKPFCQQAT